MGAIHNLVAHTDLSIEAIHGILFDGIDIKRDPHSSWKLLGDSFNCTVELFPANIDASENYVLDVPENLHVSFYSAWSVDGFINAIKVAVNWFRETTGDCAFLYGAEVVLLFRVNGETIRNSTEYGWITHEAMDLIDIPHEVKDLGIL